MNYSWTDTARPAIPASLPWAYATYDHVAAITDEEGTSVLDVSVTMNTTAASGFHQHLAYAVRAANLLPQLAHIAHVLQKGVYRANHKDMVVCACCAQQTDEPHKPDCIVLLAEQLLPLLPAADCDAALQLRAELDAKRTEANRQNIIAGRVTERLRGERDQLHRTLRAVRALIDGNQPKDLPGAVMVIDGALGA